MDARPWYLEVDEGTLIAMATDVSSPSTTPRPVLGAGRHQPTPPGGPGSSSGLLAPVSPRDQHSPASPRDQHSPARATEPRPVDGPDGAVDHDRLRDDTPDDAPGPSAPGVIGRLVPPFLAAISTALGWVMVDVLTSGPQMWWATAVVVVTMGLRLLLERALPRFGAGSRPMLGIYAVHVVLVAASVVLNPLACIYAFVGYLDSYRFFSDQQLYVLVITTAMLCAVGQTGGIGVILEEPLLFAGIAAVNLFLATLMLYMSMVREKEVAERERTLSALQQATQENDALQEELLRRAREAGVDEERARLSREIHDTVAQGLVGVIRQLETVGGELEAEAGAQETGGADGGADGGDVRRRIALAEEAARDCLVEARRAVEALAPYQLTEAGTAHGLGELVARWARTHRIVATFDADDAPSHGPHAAVLVRIAQEALANVARHSGAQTVTVTLSGSEEEQSLQVTDDGRGFDVETITRGHGLANMAQRVEEVGGRLHLSSHERRGASVIATVPG